jgi:RimJ/RimL family protein N-acetyltransferase
VAQFVYQMHPEMPVALIRVAAVSVEYRGQGGQLADATMEALLSRVATDLDAHGRGQALVVARVNLSNTPSQALMTRHGFMPDGGRTDALQEWTMLIDW